MRIVGGKYKGRRLTPPKNIPTRPTTDFAKEGLFNILQNQINFEEVKILDLFAGTGNISFEFASRGVYSIVAIEQNPKAYGFIKKTARELELPVQALRTDVFRFFKKNEQQFDIIFADPPYRLEEVETIPDTIFEGNHLKKDGILIVEHSKNVDFSTYKYLQSQRNYGNVNFSFFSYE